MGQKKYRLLIADDEENILRSMQRYISNHSELFEKIYCARNGQEAMDLIVSHHPDVMIMDIRMPVMSGLEVMKKAKGSYLRNSLLLQSFPRWVQQLSYIFAAC